MRTRSLQDILDRVDGWPAEARDAWAEIGREIEAEATGVYHATAEELAGIERGLTDAAEGRLAPQAEVEAVLAKYRRP